ncbi:hypothetical protein CPB86DRAFT_102129 [Serendipita vermifera]|nr:hypothetical protein CPB86DRAFT_102129 [Serendipita vermifera]
MLKNFSNLRVLRLTCFLCPVYSPKRHGYLLNLETRSLQEILFHCVCSTMNDVNGDVINHLASPCMKSVTALGWQSSAARHISVQSLEPFLLNREILPDLRHLHHSGQAIHYLLLQHRQIARLSTDSASRPTLTYEDLIGVRDSLSHMSVLMFDPNPLFRAIAATTWPFRNLQHIGTLLLSSITCSVSHCLFRSVLFKPSFPRIYSMSY